MHQDIQAVRCDKMDHDGTTGPPVISQLVALRVAQGDSEQQKTISKRPKMIQRTIDTDEEWNSPTLQRIPLPEDKVVQKAVAFLVARGKPSRARRMMRRIEAACEGEPYNYLCRLECEMRAQKEEQKERRVGEREIKM